MSTIFSTGNRKLVAGTVGILTVIMLLLWGYSLSDPLKGIDKSDDRNETDFQARVDEFITGGIDVLTKTREEIISDLGTPLADLERKVKNVHNPAVTDTVYEMYYDDLSVRIYKAKEKELMEHVTLSGDGYEVKWQLNIGTMRSNVKNTLGIPSEENDQLVTYRYSEYPLFVKFFFEDDVVYKIEWDFWID